MNFSRVYKAVAIFFLAISILSCTADDHGSTQCTSKICQETGEDVINSIDKTVEPCEDFYRHACGGWIAKNPLPKTLKLFNHLSELEDKLQEDMKDLMEAEDTVDTENGALQKAKDYYKSCINEGDVIGKKGLETLAEIFADNGEWPMTVPSSMWNPNNLMWQDIHENLANATGYGGLFDLNVQMYYDSPSVTNLVLTPLKGSETTFEKTMDMALKISKTRGFNISMADLEADVQKMLIFKSKFEDILTSSTRGYEKMTMFQLQHLWRFEVKDETNWFVMTYLRLINIDFQINDMEVMLMTLTVMNYDCLPKLAVLLSETSTRTIVNYMFWVVMDRTMTSQFPVDPDRIMRHPSRWRKCIKFHPMVHATSLMYVREHFTNETRASVMEMVDIVREISKETIGNSTWMDEEARELSKKKIDAIVFKVGTTDWNDDRNEVDEYYKELTVGPNYLENMLALNRLKNKHNLMRLGEPVRRDDMHSDLTDLDVTAFYFFNHINLPAALMQMPTFHREQLAALKFGRIGATIGHEISHAFDSVGRYKDNNVEYNEYWWSSSTIENHEKRVECLKKKYENYVVFNNLTTKSSTNETKYLDVNRNPEENVADNSGFPIGFKALQRYKSMHPEENFKIPALQDYSDEQLYFYGVAQYYCGVDQPTLWDVEVHAPNIVRINAGFSNFKEFSDAFQCPSGSKMNPTDKCVMWD